jgi:hypothetical protein
MNYIKLAWRNIWRNKKRTLITAGSIFFALILSILMIGLQKGVFDNMVKVSVEEFYGYIQVHHEGYVEDKTLDFHLINYSATTYVNLGDLVTVEEVNDVINNNI